MRKGRVHDERATAFDRMLTPIHRWIWRDAERRVQKLLRFGETEIDGGRDILRAAEVTSDPILRRTQDVAANVDLSYNEVKQLMYEPLGIEPDTPMYLR